MDANPVTLLTLLGALAVLTNAACVLTLNTANRYGRAFDRFQEIGKEIESGSREDHRVAFRLDLLERLLLRTRLLLRAQTAFNAAIGLFVLSALLTLAALAIASAQTGAHPNLFRLDMVAGLSLGALAICCVVCGCFLVVKETRLALLNLHKERSLLRSRHPL